MKKIALALALLGVLSGVVARPVHSAAPQAAPIGPIRTLVLGGSGNLGFNMVYADGAVTGTITRSYDVGAFNAATPAQLRALHDVIVVTWSLDPSFNLDWNTRVLPFLQLGGGVIFEDPNNLGDLSPAVTGNGDSGSGWTVSPVPVLTDGINGSFVNDHFSLTGWDPAIFSPFITTPGRTVGLYGQIPGGGRIVITGPDQDYHAMMGDNQYNLIINELNWVTVTAYDRLQAMVLALVGPGKLTARYADILVQILIRAEGRAIAGADSQAIALVRSFLSYVARYQSSGWITPAEAAALQAEANAVIALLLL